MIKILNALFASTSFYREFAQERLSERDGSVSATYRYKARGWNIVLRFFEHEGLVTSFSVVSDRRVLIEQLYFLTLEELTLLLSRIPALRAADFSRTDSEQIKALFYALRSSR